MKWTLAQCFIGALLASLSLFHSAAQANTSGNQLIFARFEFLVGESGNSLTGSYAYTGGFQSYGGSGSWKWLVGTSFTFASAGIKLSGSNRSASMYGGDFRVGGAWTPLKVLGIHPIVELAPMLGAKFLSISSPPAGIDENGLAISYGATLSVGVDLKAGSSSAIRLFFEYIYRKAPTLAGQNPLDLNAFGIGAGWLF